MHYELLKYQKKVEKNDEFTENYFECFSWLEMESTLVKKDTFRYFMGVLGICHIL